MPDHCHVLCTLSRNITTAKLVGETKRITSRWLKSKGQRYRDFRWQGGYSAFSVSISNLSRVRNYINRQEEHHRERDFKAELRGLLKQQGIEYDERYLWD